MFRHQAGRFEHDFSNLWLIIKTSGLAIIIFGMQSMLEAMGF
jgi:hypothetical protein